MLINYPYKFRLEPTEEQEDRLKHYGHTCRFIYNLALDQRNLSRDPNPLPTLLEMWQKREADKLAGIKPERKEVDFAGKWAEAIGQSLHYSRMTGKRAGILLIMLAPKDQKYLERLLNVIRSRAR